MSPESDSKHVENPYAAPRFSSLEPELVSSQDPESEELAAFIGVRADYYLRKWSPLLRGRTGSAGFNWAAFLLAGLWFPYRKMYKAAALLYGVVLFESLAEEVFFVGVLGNPEPPPALGHFVNFVVWGICGAYGNRWYLSHARKVVSEVKSQATERDVQLRVISQRGGVSAASMLGCFALFLLVMFAIFMALDFVLYAG